MIVDNVIMEDEILRDMITDVDTEFVHISETIDQLDETNTTITDLQPYHPDPTYDNFAKTFELYKEQHSSHTQPQSG